MQGWGLQMPETAFCYQRKLGNKTFIEIKYSRCGLEYQHS